MTTKINTLGEASLTAQLKAPLLAFLDEQQLGAPACRRRLSLWKPESRITLTEALICIELIRKDYPAPSIAVDMARHVNLTHLGAMGYMCLSCDSIEEIFSRSTRSYHTIWKGLKLNLQVGESDITVTWAAKENISVDHSQALSILAAFGIAGCVQLIRQLIGESFRPKSIMLPNVNLASRRSLDAFFQCPIKIQNSVTGWCLNKSDLRLPIIRDGNQLRAIFDQQIEEQLTKISGGDNFLDIVQEHIINALHTGSPSIESTAAILSMSRASLNRRLGARDTTFQQLLDDTRFNLAKIYLSDANLSLSEIASLLGYSDQSAFSRSFNRRAGMPPKKYRAENSAKAESKTNPASYSSSQLLSLLKQ